MKSLLSEKDQKIEQLEKIIKGKKENASTQVSGARYYIMIKF